MVRVKLCGMTREEDVRAAVEAGADAVGVIVGFPSSARNISLGRASRLMGLVPPFVNTVLVTTSNLIRDDMAYLPRIRTNDVQLYGGPAKPQAIRFPLLA